MENSISRLKVLQITAELMAIHDSAEALIILEGVAVGVLFLCAKSGHHDEVAKLFCEDVLKQMKSFERFHRAAVEARKAGPTAPTPPEDPLA